MPILLWYLPFTMFSSACDLMFSELEAQTGGKRAADFAEPAWDAEDAGQ